MENVKVILVFCLLVLVATGCSAIAATDDLTNVPDNKVLADQAQALYKANCIACHGEGLEGRVGPDLRKAGKRLNKSQIAKQIGEGGGKMPSYNSTLTEEEIETLARWLASQK